MFGQRGVVMQPQHHDMWLSCACVCCLLLAEDPAGDEPSECIGELRLEHVSFRYPARPDVMVMKDFCLEVEAGTHQTGVAGSIWRKGSCPCVSQVASERC